MVLNKIFYKFFSKSFLFDPIFKFNHIKNTIKNLEIHYFYIDKLKHYFVQNNNEIQRYNKKKYKN